MRIAVITSPFLELPPVAIGAVEKLFYLLAKEWVRLGHRVSFVCCGGGDDPSIEFVRIKKFCRTGSLKKDIILDFFYSLRALWRCPRADVLVCNTFWTPALAPFFKWKYKKLIFGVHRFPKGQFWLYPFVNAFICVSSAVADELRRQIGNKPNIFVINNPIDTAVFFRREEETTDSGNYTVVFAGRVHPEKGLDLLFEAAELAVSANSRLGLKLKIIGTTDIKRGGGGGEYVQRLVRLAPHVRVEWVDPISDPLKLAETIRSGDCFVYPSVATKGETFGVAPLEAMALGLPTVLTNLPCFNDFVEPKVNALQVEIGENCAASIKGAILYLMANPKEAMKLSESASNTAKRFSPQVTANKYVECFNELLDREADER